MRSPKPTTTRRAAMAGAGWIAAAVLATLIGIGGIRLVGDSLTSTPGGVLEPEDVARALASPTATASPGPSASGPSASGPSASGPSASGPSASGPSGTTPDSPPASSPASSANPSPAGERRAFSSAGGSVVAGCREGSPYLISWSPSPGYRVTRQETESEHADVRFEGSAGRSEIRVACDGNTPIEQQHGGAPGD